jgi:hypothetical protein
MASTIKVDNIQNQPGTNIINKCSVTTTVGAGAGETVNVCAATVNLGRSGGTVNLTSGATQSGFGRTGTVDWITTPKVTGDSPVTGVTGKGYFMNTTAGTITLNLPAGTAGDIVSLADYAATWQTYNVTVTPNGSEKIGGVNASVTLSTEGQSVTFVYVDSTQGWLNTMDSTSNVRGNAYITATGGTPSQCGDYEIRTFTGPGTFTVTAAAASAPNNAVDYLVVAGGGAGGAGGTQAGGGGAGGFRASPGTATGCYCASPRGVAPAAAVTVSASPGSYAVVVGGGGASQANVNRGNSGNVSSIFCISSAGGGGGGVRSAPQLNGLDGGSGGGSGSSPGGTGGSGNTPPTNPVQGTDGGPTGPESGVYAAGSGGGALVAGTGGPDASQDGGAGAGIAINPSPTYGTPGPSAPLRYFAGGGGSQKYPNSTPTGEGGVGGGGAGGGRPGSPNPAYPNGENGTQYSGGGGGGAEFSSGAGGDGVVIIRYKFQ